MAEAISAVQAEMRLAQLLGDDFLAQAPESPAAITPGNQLTTPAADFTGNPFEDVLKKAVESLESVSKTELYANQLVDKYLKGEAEISDVMAAQAKMSVMVNLAVTTVNSAVTTFKEITQIQV
jgi:flagellar hook-basal body complex protein FliE